LDVHQGGPRQKEAFRLAGAGFATRQLQMLLKQGAWMSRQGCIEGLGILARRE
jgi:hypothetical protein